MQVLEPDSCAHCGLPVYERSARQAPGGAVYCCSGCAIVAAVLGSTPTKGDRAGAEKRRSRVLLLRVGLAAFFSANAMVLTLFLYSLGHADPASSAPPVTMALIRGLLLCFSVPVFVILAPPFLRGLARDARRRRFSMDSLIAIGAGAAFSYSCVSVLRGTGEVYFDTATMVLLLVTIGRLLEANARVRGRQALLELLELQPARARVWRDDAWETVDRTAVQAGDRVQVLAGERIPIDGRIEAGAAAIDESMLTGEPLPAERGESEMARAGSLCLNGTLVIRAVGNVADSLLAGIVASVEKAQRLRSPLERLADRVAAALVPVTILLSAGVILCWWPWGHERAWLNGLSVLVVACPCAVGVALPMVNVVALAAAAKRGILIRSSEALERLAEIDTIVLDKTGTVTSGQVEVKRIIPVGSKDAREVLERAAAAAADSLHPVAQAVQSLARQSSVSPEERRRVEVLPGRGVRAELQSGRQVLLGHPRWVESQVERVPADWRDAVTQQLDAASGAAWCAVDKQLLGALLVEDPVSATAAQAVAECRQTGFRLVLLSGDRDQAVQRAASCLGISEAWGGLLPEEKAEHVKALRLNGARVAMVGDGINDAPALAAADVGVAVSNGTDVAREVAEAVFLEGGLWKLPELMQLAQRTRRAARKNLAWTFVYNSVALALAAGGLLRPIWAAAIMLSSSILVIWSALRLPSRIRAVPR